MPDSSSIHSFEARTALAAEVSRIFNDLIFDNNEDCFDLNDAEETLYHQIYEHIEHQNKLLHHIPSPPKQLLALLSELEKEESDFTRIQDIIKNDLALVGEIIRVSNCPLYRSKAGEISSLEKAVSMLGIEGVTKVASTIMMRKAVNIDAPKYKPYAKKLWNYCLKCAEACQIMAQSKDEFTHYLLGLLHNIGSVVVFSCYIELSADKNESTLNDLKIIQRVMMERAPWLSTLVAGEWALPERYLDTLNEYSQIVSGDMDEENHLHASESAKIMESAVLCTQVYTLIKYNLLDKKTGVAGLNEIEISNKLIVKLFSRFDLADA